MPWGRRDGGHSLTTGGHEVPSSVDGRTSFIQYARMRRTTISLPDDVAAALEREAGRHRVSVSQVAREAIEARLGWTVDRPRDLPFIGIAESQGDQTDHATHLDEYLDEHWVADIGRDADPGSR